MALVAPVENGKVVSNTSSEESTAAKGNDLGYDQFLQLLCAEMQYQDPLEPTSNTEYVAQLATFSQMEAMLAMQNSIDSSKANALVGKYVIIQTTSSTTGDTSAIAGYVDFVHYENGKQFVSVNGNLYSVDDVYEVMDPEYMEAVALADAFAAAVKKLPSKDQLTLSDQADIENIRTVLDSLTAYQQSYIPAESLETFAELEGTMISMVFNDTLSKLPAIDEITLENKDTVAALRKTYDALSTYQKTFIGKDAYEKLEALEKKIAELEAAKGDTDS